MSVRQIIINQVMRLCDPADMEVGNWELCTDNILSALAEAGISLIEWKPMSECPKHEEVLTVMKHGIISGRWDGETCGQYYWRDMEWYPYAWSTLPSPPKESK